jgi:antitoxin (DNA-binding transcriptional repressor) of toxin-antitoxin stability system
MSASGQPGQAEDDGIVADAGPACVALVPMAQPTQWTRTLSQPARPASTFITQLLATADHAPQTRSLRRATAADAQTAYSANQRPARPAGIRTRQSI